MLIGGMIGKPVPGVSIIVGVVVKGLTGVVTLTGVVVGVTETGVEGTIGLTIEGMLVLVRVNAGERVSTAAGVIDGVVEPTFEGVKTWL